MNDYKSIVSLEYKAVFDDYDTVDVVVLLRNIPSKNSLEIICHFLAQIHTNEREFKYQIDHLRVWLGRLPQETHQRIGEFIHRILSSPKAEFNFINNFSGLLFIETILENYNELPIVANLTPEQELQLFKAYLWCSQGWIDRQSKAFVNKKIETADDFIRLSLPIQAPQIEIIEFKDFRLQFIKAIYFFRFCEKNGVFKKYLENFLKEKNVKSWQEHLRNLISGYLRKLNPPIPSIMTVADEQRDFKNWMETLCLNVQNFNRSDDFQSLRENPLFKLDADKFLFLNLNFFIDKIYQGIQFDFGNALVKNNVEYNGKRIERFLDFRQIYAEVFSESGLFYEVLNYVFEKNKYLMFTSDKMNQYLNGGAPDFYIRDSAKIYLFEFKDTLFSAKTKNSYDYEQIVAEINKKMVENEKGRQKGVTQLVNSIEKLSNGEFKKIDNYDFSKAIIYPIIAYTDLSFSVPGINYLLNKEFQKQIETKGLNRKFQIKRLTMIDLDSLIKFQDIFREKKITINHCLNGYAEYLTSSNILTKATTFSQYIHYLTSKMKYDSPKMLIEEAIKLLPAEKKGGN